MNHQAFCSGSTLSGSFVRALKPLLGESASPAGLIASPRMRVVAEPALQCTGAGADLLAVMAKISGQVCEVAPGSDQEVGGSTPSPRVTNGMLDS